MTNKNVLQIISGALLFLSFFSGWHYYGGFSSIYPMEFVSRPEKSAIFKLFLVVPVLGVAHIYFGVIKKYNPLIHKISVVVTVILMLSMKIHLSGMSGYNAVSTGFYLAGCSVIASVASFFIVEKEIRFKGIDSQG
ncbi:hypothetical protein [Bacillus cereus]|uniref:DUF3995 domain-containing protein n=1 Tax=Bacillus cereus TaxID=1396 RepID=A0A2B1KUF0_BACCE|nr:hypothetical protein [Bacillus cereus]PFN27642.1 hypothetical protein COJ50_07955 [Bacillus cereus]